jgi:metacaspase-1
MPNGYSLHIGLNAVDPAHYGGWSGPLNACEFDANDMTELARSQGFTTTQLLTKDATRDAVIGEMGKAARALKAGDIFCVTYSGHGGQVPDQNGDESDSMDETWCLFDGQLIDDETFHALGKFAAGVRILVLSDSCHSGTSIKARIISERNFDPTRPPRAAPDEVLSRTYYANKKFYDTIGGNPNLKNARNQVAATAVLISGCQDNQLSLDGPFNGAFTAMVKRIWNGGVFKGDYPKFHKTVQSKMPLDQTPNYFVVGAANRSFEKQKPFTV